MIRTKNLIALLTLLFSLHGMAQQSITVTSVSVDTICNKGFFYIDYQATGTFNPGNVFYAEISDETGSFANAYPISYSTSAMSGSLGNFAPMNGLTAGTGYRVRIVSSNPAINGTDNGTDLTLFYPDISVTSSPGQLEATTTVPGTTFQWADCGGLPLSGETNAVFSSGTANQYYEVEITQKGCVDTSACEVFTATNSLQEEGVAQLKLETIDLQTGQYAVVSTSAMASVDVLIYSGSGQLIVSDQAINTNRIEWTLPQDAGIYFVEIRTEKGLVTRYTLTRFN